MSSLKKKEVKLFDDENIRLESLPISPPNCNFGVYYKDTKKGSDSKAADTSVLPMRINKGVGGVGYLLVEQEKRGSMS